MDPTPARAVTWRWAWAVGLVLALVLGAVLRLIWVRDIEYKGDESWTFERTQRVGRTEPFPWLGMPTSASFRNPGMSVWVFLLLGKLCDVHDPTELARAVQYLNLAGLVLLVWFACRTIPRQEREPWLWAAALAAVSPLAVLFQRKIWPPSVLPPITLLFLAAWWHRERRWSAFAWGLVGACLGQIHMAGFFFAAGIALWTLLFDRKRVAWLGWLGGSCCGALPLIPWLWYFLLERGGGPVAPFRWWHVLECKFWLRWVTEPLGISLEYALTDDFWDFLRYPLVHGQPTFLGWLLHGLLITLGAVLLVRLAAWLWRERGHWIELGIGRHSATAFTQSATLWGFGILLTALSLPITRHYLLVAYPLGFVWLARLALGSCGTWKLGRPVLATLCATQFLISACFLGYIHVNQRPIHGDYGTPYGAQQRAAPPVPTAMTATRLVRPAIHDIPNPASGHAPAP
jgi:hypothetical protein